jgi:hypothetical protein
MAPVMAAECGRSERIRKREDLKTLVEWEAFDSPWSAALGRWILRASTPPSRACSCPPSA